MKTCHGSSLERNSEATRKRFSGHAVRILLFRARPCHPQPRGGSLSTAKLFIFPSCSTSFPSSPSNLQKWSRWANVDTSVHFPLWQQQWWLPEYRRKFRSSFFSTGWWIKPTFSFFFFSWLSPLLQHLFSVFYPVLCVWRVFAAMTKGLMAVCNELRWDTKLELK